MPIRNRDRLATHGDLAARKALLEITEAALAELNVSRVIRELLALEGDTLRVGARRYRLGAARRLFVVGAGKAANTMAKAVEDLLGDRITQGLAIVKRLESDDALRRIELVEGGHPLPNAAGQAASQRILELVRQARPDDLFISLISGGSSALMSCPLPGISLEDEQQVTEALLTSGARILEVNAIRRHVSALNGGRLAERIEAAGAELINLIISDSVGRMPVVDPGKPAEFVGTPVAPDGTTLQDARETLDRYQLWERAPRSIADFLKNAGPGHETPKAFGPRVRHFVLQRPGNACESARKAAEAAGLPACILTTQLEGESREAGGFLACVGKEIVLNARPLAPPCVLIAGGETTTRVEGSAGLGGPSQELSLGFALEVAGRSGLAICALDTDGTDGPTGVAGGIADGRTLARARELGMDVYRRLREHDSGAVLQALDDAILTGNTGTNLCDLNLIYVSGEKNR
jgi:glycerate 2-kinase